MSGIPWVVRFLENSLDGCEVFDCIIVVVLFTGVLGKGETLDSLQYLCPC